MNQAEYLPRILEKPVRRNPQIPCGTIRRSPDRRSNWREAPASVTLLTVGHCFIV
jgi:hypothetical protein